MRFKKFLNSSNPFTRRKRRTRRHKNKKNKSKRRLMRGG